MANVYVSAAKLSIEEGMALILSELSKPKKGKRTSVMGREVHLTGDRLRTFAQHGADCQYCGRKGTHFSIEMQKGNLHLGYHMNMYGEGDVLMTKAGGKTTCIVCHDHGVTFNK